MRFVKMQATGNDYVYVTENETEGKDLSALAAEVSDRRTGIGSDGLIVLAAAGGGEEKEYELKMRIFNADGSEGVTCGNGVRCAAKFAYEKMGITVNPMRVLTGSGIRSVRMMESDGKIVYAEAEMGKPHTFALDPRQRACMEEVGLYVDYRSIIPVNVGNLHLVFFEENEKSPLMLAKLVESGGAFPDLENIIKISLRIGDVATKYSSCQYLVMLIGAKDKDSVNVAERVVNNYKAYADKYAINIKFDTENVSSEELKG